MGLERRGNGLYFYRKERRGSRVVSVYEASGEMAHFFSILDKDRQRKEREEKEEKKRAFEAEKQSVDKIDQLVNTFCQEAKAFEDALYLINGYHQHSRAWRKKRDGKKG